MLQLFGDMLCILVEKELGNDCDYVTPTQAKVSVDTFITCYAHVINLTLKKKTKIQGFSNY